MACGIREKTQTKEMRQMTDPELRETQIDLMIGCVIHSLIFEGIGLLVVPNRLSYSLGLVLGTCTALACSYSMYRGIMRCAGQDAWTARRKMSVYSILRMVFMFLVCAGGLLTSAVSFPGVLVGLIGLKTAAYLHVYTNVYITRKYFRKYL